MLRTMILALLAAVPAVALAAPCAGPDPSIVSAVVKNVTSAGQLDQYHLSVTVTNLGSAAQASNALQSVDVYEDGQKHDTKGIPPLKAGQSYTFSYIVNRSTDAGKGTSKVIFKLMMHQGTECSSANDTRSVSF